MSLKRNVLANYLGQGWRAIMSLAFVPLYIQYLGIEVYGLIGIFAILQVWLSLLDMGMKPALGREMARFTGGDHDTQSIWDLLRSIEIIALGVAVLIGLGVWAASDWLATSWVQAEKIPISVAANAFALMGLIAALRFIENIYTSSIAGLQYQVLQNVVVGIMETFRGVGAVVVLVWIEPTIGAFFIWQGLISLVMVSIFMIIIYRVLPRPANTAQFSLTALHKIWKFAAGMLGITLLSLLLMQIDKILLSSLLSLEGFGYYTLASLVAGSLYIMTSPIAAAFYPRFTELLTRNDDQALCKVYHLSAQLVTVLTGSAAVMLILFADRILLLWTADPALTEQVASVMRILTLGTFLNCLVLMPYQMQLAHGWTSLSIRGNMIAVAFIVPAIFLMVPIYGAMAAAWIWVILNTAYFLIGAHFMYQRILILEKWTWYYSDILVPLTFTIVTGLLSRWIFPEQLGRIYELFVLAGVLFLILTVASLSAPLVRRRVINYASCIL
jgi:O-antigen/teichoic acid export membrane protein